ncbi:MAG: branched-chain amino acid aminotransferase [Clostridiales bacterium]|jgi:branched-chain amino acid aminotransferase|nr:branched-chain amino acid aminotransferase [Clostridiales bacterium]
MEIRTTLCLSPKPKPPVDSLGFGKYFTDHMFTLEYNTLVGWHDASIVPYGPLSLDPASMVLHYGQGVFEGLKCYKAADGRILLFRPEKNFERLNLSHERVCIPKIDVNFCVEALTRLIQIDKDWIPGDPDASLYIRPFTFAAESALGVHPSSSYKFMIILSPVGSYYPEGINPVRIYVEDEYVRAVRGGLGFTKAIANYASSLKGQEKAKEKGYTQVLWLDGVERKYIEEVGTMNVFFVIGSKTSGPDELVTPEINGSILRGITRESVIELARSWGVIVKERRISIQELYDVHKQGLLKEAFGSGTAAVISPIKEFNWDGRSITLGGDIGPMARRLYDTLTGIQYGRLPDTFGWVKEVGGL